MYKSVSLNQRGGFGVAPTARDRLKQALNEGLRIQTLRTVLLIQAIAARVGINPIDLQCLNLLTLYGPLTPSRLAEAMSLAKGGAITAMIDRLETAGYMHRRRDTQDRRQVLLHITPGEPLRRLMAHIEAISEAITALTADYTDDQPTPAHHRVHHPHQRCHSPTATGGHGSCPTRPRPRGRVVSTSAGSATRQSLDFGQRCFRWSWRFGIPARFSVS
jgi:DNA-binding MarR family transcriptional regulator